MIEPLENEPAPQKTCTDLSRIFHKKKRRNRKNSLKYGRQKVIQERFRGDRMLPEFLRLSIRFPPSRWGKPGAGS